MNNIFDFNDYLQVGDEVKLNKLGSKVEMELLLNDAQMHNYDVSISFQKMTDLYKLYNEVMILQQEAVVHNNRYMYDVCEVYLFDLDYQMHLLRKIACGC